MSIIRVNNVEYKIHPIFDLFGVDNNGNIINICTKKAAEHNQETNDVKVKSFDMPKFRQYNKLVFVWESNKGMMSKGDTVCRINEEQANDGIQNLRLVKIIKIKLSPKEIKLRDKMKNDIWRNTVWDCPDCGFRTTNNASGHHRRVCKYSKNPYSEEEFEKKNASRKKWARKTFICEQCGKQLVNSGKYAHKRICKRDKKMEK